MPAFDTNGAYHIANNQVEYNPQRTNNFTLVVHDMDLPLLRVGANPNNPNKEKDYIPNPQEEITIGLKSCTTPSVDLNSLSVSRGNSVIKFTGKPSFNDITVVAYDYIGSNVKDTFLAWQNQAYNTYNDYIGNAWAYKKNCTLYEYTPAGVEVRHWDIQGAWAKKVSVDDFDYENDKVATVTATLSIDWAELQLPSLGG